MSRCTGTRKLGQREQLCQCIILSPSQETQDNPNKVHGNLHCPILTSLDMVQNSGKVVSQSSDKNLKSSKCDGKVSSSPRMSKTGNGSYMLGDSVDNSLEIRNWPDSAVE